MLLLNTSELIILSSSMKFLRSSKDVNKTPPVYMGTKMRESFLRIKRDMHRKLHSTMNKLTISLQPPLLMNSL